MLHIGICDDVYEERQIIFNLCKEYFKENAINHDYVSFSNGEDVLLYCKKDDNKRIDLLFLDVEMPGISGIELKDAVIKKDKVWRIVFVTNHMKSIYGAFGRKTIGFISKPPVQEKINKMIAITLNELEENVVVIVKGHDGKAIEIQLEDIAYFRASGSYTEIVVYSLLSSSRNYILCTKKLGDLEKEMESYPIIRVHKSYMVNLANIVDFGEKIILRNLSLEIPAGRAYKEQARKKYLNYGRQRIKKIL
ncbi:MAG: LytR/AlgR family response regulator transcription factor [Clostridiaceae bacterium]